MFRPGYILQVVVASILLSACASEQTDANAHYAKQAVVVSTSSATATPQVATSIGTGDFIQPNGTLLPEVEVFARQTASAHNIPYTEIKNLLAQARFNSSAARLMAPPKSGKRSRKAWQSYRQRHVDHIRIERGVEFWRTNHNTLEQASSASGVPASIIVAIIGIETVYGHFMGEHRVLDTLTTLAFRYPDASRPERQQMFRSQLADLMLLHHQQKLDAVAVHGSYAGAIGLAQFMPGSLLRYAVDGDADGVIDLITSTSDAIFSIANFLRQHGWVPGLPVFAPVSLPPATWRYAQDGLEPETNWASLSAAGATARPGAGTAWQTYPLGIIDLRDEIRDTHDMRCVTANFFAITQYNRSYFYAASVAELAQEIATQMGYSGPNTPVDR